MEEIYVSLERHEQQLKMIQRDIAELRGVQNEIKAMNETLATLTNELKHTNEHLGRHERKIGEIENQPKARMQQIVTAIISALSGALISAIVGFIIK
jgi:flagellar biosynthesis chaperone FliJ